MNKSNRTKAQIKRSLRRYEQQLDDSVTFEKSIRDCAAQRAFERKRLRQLIVELKSELKS